jgi:hypothetical protein
MYHTISNHQEGRVTSPQQQIIKRGMPHLPNHKSSTWVCHNTSTTNHQHGRVTTPQHQIFNMGVAHLPNNKSLRDSSHYDMVSENIGGV